MKLNDLVIYIDNQGGEHNALIADINGLNEGVIDVVYIAGGEVKRVYSIFHASDESKQEVKFVSVSDPLRAAAGDKEMVGNPNLPSYVLNAYKFPGEEHKAPPSDHAIFDHPFEPKELDANQRPVEKKRPEFAAEVAAHNGE